MRRHDPGADGGEVYCIPQTRGASKQMIDDGPRQATRGAAATFVFV
jgi:hypothetical protein